MNKKTFDISKLDIRWFDEQKVQSALQREAYYSRLIEAVELIDALKWCDLNRANEWIKKHKERLTDAYALNEIIGIAVCESTNGQEAIREAVEKELKKTRSVIGKKGAEAKRKSDPKQLAMNEVKANWKTWQGDLSTYRSKAAFARDQLAAYPDLESQKNIEDNCRKWERESTPKKP